MIQEREFSTFSGVLNNEIIFSKSLKKDNESTNSKQMLMLPRGFRGNILYCLLLFQ